MLTEFATNGSVLSASQSLVSLGMTEGSLEYAYVRLILIRVLECGSIHLISTFYFTEHI